MLRRILLKLFAGLVLLPGFLCSRAVKPPNILLLFVDDMGYGDLGCQGNTTVKSPRIDELASEGVRFTQWISGDSICTPSRGALLTGRLPVRIGLASGLAKTRVLKPLNPRGLPHNEHTIAEALKERGYNTHLTGKWHLGIGDGGEFLPTMHGFDHFYGMGITNVLGCMPGKKYYSEETLSGFVWNLSSHVWIGLLAASSGAKLLRLVSFKSFILCLVLILILFSIAVSLMEHLTLIGSTLCLFHRDREIIQQPVDLNNLTQRLTENAESFISKSVNQEKPFFLYMSYLKLHVALFSNPEFKSSFPDETEFPEYQYTNNILELDWSVGAIVDHLKQLGVFENTIIWFASDNGPFLERGVEGGSKSFYEEEDGEMVLKTLRGGKAQIWEGGFRVPGIVVYKNIFPSKTVTNEPVSTMDIFPTSLNIIDEILQENDEIEMKDFTYSKKHPHTILDGKDLTSMIRSIGSEDPQKSPHEAMIHYCGENLSAVRLDGKYKAYFSTPIFSEENDETCRAQAVCECQGDGVVQHNPPLIFDLDEDIQERNPLSPANFSGYAEIIQRVNEAVRMHESSVRKFPHNENQMNNKMNLWMYPTMCCNFPICSCDKLVDPASAV